MRLILTVAGGHSKARAIVAAAKAYRMDVLVTDEGAAREILNHELEG
jgi:central glycolytic genes regulator